jgi:aminoglycoside phosphotransferase (APT) family kinase protein
MKGKYLGYLSRQDPLYGFLTYDILRRIDVYAPHPEYRVFKLVASNTVYLYEEKQTRACVVGKFFGPTFGWDRNRAMARAEREYGNLETLRGSGLVGCPHHVIRPLGLHYDLGCLLVQEHYRGEALSQAINGAIHQGHEAHLFWRLKALGYFLATQHNRTANGQGVDFEEDCRYLDHLLGDLLAQQRIDCRDADEFRWLRDQWRAQPAMWQDQQVWLHGDATPANFLFGGGLDVAAIDLERMKRGDRVFDVGRIAGELMQAFLNATGDKNRAEPFIGHFLWEYACHFPDRYRAFRSITERTPYYMGLTLLRIARNSWVSPTYGRTLIEQAKQLLRSYWKHNDH